MDRSNSLGLVSVIRKDLLDEIVRVFKKHNIRLLDIYIGFGVYNILHEVLEIDVIQTTNYRLNYKDDSIVDFGYIDSEERMYKIGDHQHSNTSLGSIAGVFNYWLQLIDVDTVEYNYLERAQKEERYKNLLTRVGGALVTLMFVVLMCNLLLFQNINKKNDRLRSVSNVNGSKLTEVERLKSEIRDKRELINSVGGIKSGSFFAYYADKIAGTLPEQLSLQKMYFRPLQKKIKANVKVQFEIKSVKIEGRSSSSGELNDWLVRMRELDFIDKVELISYLSEGKKKGWFELLIEIQ